MPLLLLTIVAAGLTVQPPVRTLPARPQTNNIELVPNDVARANVRPDLVVREIRMDGDQGFRALIANQGTADTTQRFEAVATAWVGSSRGFSRVSMAPLGAGQEMWVPFSRFKFGGERDYFGRPDTFPYAQVERVQVTLDAPMLSIEAGRICPAPAGCVREMSEDNNELSTARAELAPSGG